MTHALNVKDRQAGGRRSLLKWIAGGAAAALAAGMLVVAGVGVQQAMAAPDAPGVSASTTGTYLAGEDLSVALTFTSASAGDQYNLSAGIVLPEDVTVLDTGTLGAPIIFPTSPGNRVIPGVYADFSGDCSALGLEDAPGPSNACQVPLGKQYLVFQNISDLPDGASATHTLTLRPRADSFPVGSTELDIQVTAYTSADERFIPVFPGSKSVAGGNTHTSAPGLEELNVPVNALRIEKSEPSPESELLRGVHQNTTTYTLRVFHTGEGDIQNSTVVDFLPAGLEYLGLGGTDNTSNANGTQGVPAEYPGAPSLTATPAPAPAPGAWQTAGETVETVIPTPEEVAAYGLVAGAVYTKVTWNLDTLFATTDTRSAPHGVEQVYAGTAGTPGLIEIRYRAGIPLFENTLDFDGSGGQPGITGQQIANLDNNRGASTRHGHPEGDDSAAPATSYTNVAVASGEYEGNETEDFASEIVDAVDLRILKDVDDEIFTQNGLARYTLNVATSEYTSAAVPGPNERPYRLVDDLANGLCPVFPVDTPVADGSSSQGAGVPNLVLGDPRTGSAVRNNTVSDWNAALAAAGVSPDCAWNPSGSTVPPAAGLEGAELIGIAFDAATGHFFLDFALDPANALTAGNSAGHDIEYSVRQNATYVDGAVDGATTSGDTVANHAEIYGLTTSIPALAGVTSGTGAVADGVWNAWDDSDATLHAQLTQLEKKVLEREAGVPLAENISKPSADGGADAASWVDSASTPFAIGDQVWYRVKITPPGGTDVRNPKFTDFLPEGVVFDPTDADDNGIPDDMWIVPSEYEEQVGDCKPVDEVDWINTFVPSPQITDNVLTFELGDNCGLGGSDRFLPLNTTLEIYLKVTVVDQSAFGRVDLSENLAKYQQNNVEGEIFFLRDAAEITLAQEINMVKGIRDINGEPVPGNAFDSNVDHQEVVQGDEVTFRIDVTGPEVDSTDYVIWDALPVGVKKADIKGVQGDGSFTSATAASVTQSWFDVPDTGSPLYPGFWELSETTMPAGWTATVYDYDAGTNNYPGAPASVNTDLRSSVKTEQRSIVVWTIDDPAVVPGSIPAVPATPETETTPASPAIPGAAQGVTLGYTVTVPAGVPGGGAAALLEQEYVNDASVVQYSAISNWDGTTVLVPTGDDTLSTRAADTDDGEYAVTQSGTFDPSDIFLPGAEIEKTLVSTEIEASGTTPSDTNNPRNVIVQGEYATFDYSVEVPANTTVREGVLADLGNFVGQSGNGTISPSNTFAYKFESATVHAIPAGLNVVLATATDPAASSDPLTFGFRTDTGKLIFPEYYTTGDDPETFTVRIVVWTNDVDATDTSSSSTRPNIPNNKVLRNTAVFDSKDFDGGQNPRIDDWADVTYREPNLAITKVASPDTEVQANQPVTYTLTVTNTTNRVKSYDNVVVDTVPAGLLVNTTPLAAAGATFSPNETALQTGLGGTIIWSYEQFSQLEEIPTTATLSYTATIDPSTGAGTSYVNNVQVTGQTLPESLDPDDERRGDRRATASETITAITASIDKGVRVKPAVGDPAYASTASAPIGETVQYKVDMTLNALINYYDVRVRDTLPAGVSIVEGTLRVQMTEGTDAPEDITSAWSQSQTGQIYTWTYDLTGGDLESHDEDRTLTFTYDVQLANTVAQNVGSLPNTADFTWATTNGGALRTPITDNATVTVLNPALQIVKKVDALDSITRNPDASFDYTLTVSQTATGNTPAHNITVQDVVPVGVVVDPLTITNGGALTGAGANGGGTITWQLDGPLHQPAGAGTPKSIELGYTASFADSTALTASALTNVANVTHFESFDEGGRSYDPPLTGGGSVRDTAAVTPLFPNVVPTKSVTAPVAGQSYGIAYEGQAFNWTLTIRNQGTGLAQDISVTDTLPVNWEYAGNAQISLDGGTTFAPLTPAPTLNPATVADGDQQTILWSEATIAGAGGAPLAASGSFIITFDAVPTAAALGDPGTGIIGNGVKVNPHTNTLSVTATDTQDNDENASGDYVGDDSTATAYIGEADLLLQKEGIGGVTDSAAFDDLDEGTWIAGQGATTGYAQPQWRITVTNQGPDAGYGPFVVTDTMPTLPDGVTLSSWTARYYSGPSDTTGTDLGTFAAGSGTFTLGTTTTNLKADGSDRIVLLANVTIDATVVAAATPAAVELTNTASVTGRTYEDPDNLDDNTDSDTKPLDELADLAIAKEISSPVPPTVPAVGSAITWQITASNIGPSVSLSTAENPITITDTVPAGVTGVTATSNGDWVPTVTRDGDPSTFPAEAGDVVTWTYQGTAMPVGATASVSLAGTILSSHTGALTNAATVNPGDTPDPVTPNNTDEVTVTPNDSTTLTIAKSRVVSDGAGGWRQADPDNADDAFVAGDPVHYRITVTNNGPADARGVTVVDEVPTGLSYDTRVGIVGIVGSWGYASGGTTSTGTNAAWNTFTLSGTQVAGAPNATSFVVTYDTATTITGDVVNWAEVTADNWDPTDPSGPYDRDDDSTGSTRIVDLGIVKSHTGAGPFTPGTEVEYTLVVTNHGPSATNGVIEIEDSLPVGLSYVADSASVTVPAGTTAPADPNPTLSGTDDRVLTWELLEDTDTFDLNQTITVTFRALLDPTLRESATLTNVAIVDGPDAEPDPDPNPNRSEDEIETGPTSAVMTIGKAVEAGPWLAGTNVSYTLTVTNDGPSAVPASVTDTLPDGLTLVSMTGTNWDCSEVVAGELSGTCDYLDEADTNPVTQVLHPLGTSTITVVAYIAPSVLTGTSRLNEAVLTWNDGDGTHTDEDDEPIIVTTDGDLGIVKDVITGAEGTVVPDPAPATAGETVWYRLQVTNHGPSDAVGPITVTDTLPLGVSVPATLTSVGPWTVVPGPVDPVTGQTVVFTLADGQMASTATDAERGIAPVIEFEADLDPAIADGQLLTNEAEVSSPTPDSNLLNNEDEAVIHVGRVADLAIAKSHPSQPDGMVHLDEPLDFTILVTNNGPSVATGITVTDTVPVGLEVTSAVGPVLDADDNPTGWTIDSIDLVDPDDVLGGSVVVASYTPMLGVVAPDNEAAPFVLSTIVRESAYGTAPNHAEVAGNEVDPDLDNNEVDDPLDVRPRVTLVVEKTAVGEFQVGKTGTYRITVENLGPQPDPGPITVADVLPAGLTFHSSPSLPAGADLEVAGQTVTWTLPDGLAVDESATLTLVVNVLQAAYPSVTNVVTIDSPAEKTPESVLSDDETVTVKAVDPLAVTGGSAVGYLAMLAALLMLAGGVAAATRREKGRHAIAE
ncbi:MAG: isopeptide-forming domain-containing fimbrial protein [Leucobacter sp.]